MIISRYSRPRFAEKQKKIVFIPREHRYGLCKHRHTPYAYNTCLCFMREFIIYRLNVLRSKIVYAAADRPSCAICYHYRRLPLRVNQLNIIMFIGQPANVWIIVCNFGCKHFILAIPKALTFVHIIRSQSNGIFHTVFYIIRIYIYQ